MKVIHNKLDPKIVPEKVVDDFLEEYHGEDMIERADANFTSKTIIDLDAGTVYQLLKNIPDEDIIFMNMKKELCRPVDFMITSIPVPPSCIRPSVAMQFGLKNEDDLTCKISEII